MKPDSYRRIKTIIAAMCKDKGEVHYTDLVRALMLSPSHAGAVLRALCPGEYESGTCHCAEVAKPEPEPETQEVAEE
jgi:hypothetical protein